MATGAGRLTGIVGVGRAARNAQALPLSEDGEARALTDSEVHSRATTGATIEALNELNSAVNSEVKSAARNEVLASVMAMPLVIEVSDEDYRSFCFPCHALEEADDGNDGY